MTRLRLFIVALTLLLLGLQLRLWLGEGGFTQLAALDARVAQLRAENQVQQRRNAIRRAEIQDLKQGLDAVEALARSELGLIRQGETFFLPAED